MPPGEYLQGLKGVERSNREEDLKREITRRVARGESLDGLLGHISGLLVKTQDECTGTCSRPSQKGL